MSFTKSNLHTPIRKDETKITERHVDQEFFCGTLSLTSLYADLAPTLILSHMQLLSPPMTKSVVMIVHQPRPVGFVKITAL